MVRRNIGTQVRNNVIREKNMNTTHSFKIFKPIVV